MADLRPVDAARQLGVSVRELLLLIDRGALPRGKDERGRLVVPEAAVTSFRASSS